MPTPKKGARLGGSPAHQKLILSNLATQLFEHGRITTTEARARLLRPVAEKLITKAKKGDLHNRREVLKTIRDKSVVHTLFTEIADTFAERPGGYTRITKLGPRKGDNAPMAVIELVTEAYQPKPAAAKKAAPAETKVEEPKTEAVEELEAVDGAEAGAIAEEATPEAADAVLTEGASEGATEADSAEPLEDGSAPEGFTIKGNKDSMKFHTPESQWYDQTVAEVWFRTEAAAEAAGFTKAG